LYLKKLCVELSASYGTSEGKLWFEAADLLPGEPHEDAAW